MTLPRSGPTLAAVLGCLGLAGAAGAYTSSDGHGYRISCNANGYVLTSKYPTERYIEAGAASHVIEGIETLYLGKSCDAYMAAFGEGSWGWANGGFGADFPAFSIRFPRAELWCPEGQPDPVPDLACGW